MQRASIAPLLAMAILGGGLAVTWHGPVDAAGSVIKQRQAIFDTFGEAVKEPGAMLRQERAFDLAVVQASLKAIAEGPPKLKSLFPEDSKTGGNTEALPTVWTMNADFMKLLDKLAIDAAAAQGAIRDEASFQREWGKVSANCRACHKTYRVLPKS